MRKVYTFILLLFIFPSADAQNTVNIVADKDNTIYSIDATLSNGAGDSFFAGVTGANSIVRFLVHFDLSSIPNGSVITAATLTLRCSKLAPGSTGISLNKVTQDWGEGTSDAPSGEGKGATATTGDATWTKRFHPATPWTTAGGDFSAVPTATVDRVSVGVVSITGSNLIADIQAFVNNPATNFGWIGRGTSEASTSGNAARFASSKVSNGTSRPSLSVTYSSTLPITLKTFSASLNKQNALLKWSTATEINNDHFEIEHSLNGKDFSSIAQINASGTSSAEHSYTYSDENITPGKHFYRITDIDKSGNKHYSQVITLASKIASAFQLYPNPATTSISMVTSSLLRGSQFTISSLAGETVLKGIVGQQQIDVQKLTSGSYWFTIITTDGELLKTQFIKR